MPNTFTVNTFSEVYKDDYRDSDHYHKILFNNGRAVQQRELNQLQTIINKEVERFGRNIFKEGASVSPISNVKVDNKYRYVKVTQTSLPATDLIGLEFTGQTTGVVAKVIGVAEYVDANNPLTLYVEYVNTDTASVSPSDEPITFSLSENIQNSAEGITFTVGITSDSLGYGTKGSIGEGVFFVRGHFVYSQPQEILLSRYTSTPTTELGFKVIEDIITVDDTTALYDNTGAVPNLSSPGADRYRIRLELIAQEDIQANENFVYVAAVVDGQVVDINNGRREYNRIYDVMAERTYEESGNYAVKPFLSTFEEHPTDDSKLILKVQPGLAYVRGYRSEPGGKRIEVNKPTASVALDDQPVSASYGNYALIDEPVGLFAVDEYELVQLKDAAAGLGNTIGSARVRSMELAGAGKYRLYLFAVTLNTGKAFRDVLSVATVDGRYADMAPDGPFPQLLDATNNNLFFTLPRKRPNWNNAPSFDMTVQRTFTETANGSGEVTVDTGGNGTFAQSSEWLVFDNTNALVTVPLANFGSTGGTSLTISGLSAGQQYSVLTLVDVANVPPRKKTVTSRTFQTSVDSDGTVSLERADIINVISVTDDSTGNDITADFRLDDGQRDNYYGIGKLTLIPGRATPATTITVNYRYFAHSTSGGYFYASSYKDNPGFTYGDIPVYRTADGQVVDLKEAVDFRPTLVYTGTTFTNTAQGGRINELPRNTDTLASSLTYYYPRNDLLVVTIDEELEYIEGVPSFEPEFPKEPLNAMALYRIELGANTVGVDDLNLEYIDNRRYTMRDIGKLERRIEQNRELITLSLLEVETSTLEVLDENGLPRTKAGFFVDNFTNHRPSDVADPSYFASLDIEQGVMRPHFNQKEISLVYDSASSSSVVRRKNAVMLNYSHELFVDQPKASGVINVNPYNVITNTGVMTLTPTKDNWRDETRIPGNVIPAGWISQGRPWSERIGENLRSALNRIDPNWRMWDWSWWGRNDLTGTGGRISTANGRNEGDFVRFLDANNVSYNPREVRNFVNTHGHLGVIVEPNQGEGRTVNTVSVPFMRSREIAVKVTGLMPFTRHYPFFDEVDVQTWCKQLTESEYNDLVALNRSDTPPVFSTDGMSERPDGFTAGGLTSDENGTLFISFLIPNTDNYLFSTGTLEFAVYDITSPVASVANSQAAAEYTASGVEETIRETSSTVRLTNYDPIAQSFINGLEHGVFLTKVDVFVATKDASRPLICEIRPLVNGFPSASERLRYGIATLLPDDITTSGDATVATTFEFERPVYLEAGTEYAVVLRSESNQYFVWQATMGDFELGSTEKKITAQPYMGSLFASQNGSTWEPEQDKDLKFQLYIANFETSGLSGQAFMENAQTPLTRLPVNPFEVDAGTNLRVHHPYHGMIEGDLVTLSRWTDADSDEAGLTDFTPAQLETDSAGVAIFNVDASGYSITLPSSATVTERGGGTSWQASANHKYHTGRNAVNTFQPLNTSLAAYNRFTSIASLMQSPVAYSKDISRVATTLQSDISFNSPKVIASQLNEDAQSTGKSLDLELDLTTSNKYLSPVINIEDASFMTIENIIDWQSDSAATNRLVPYVYVDETDPASGTSLSKYITKDVAIEEASTGLKILLAANKPFSSDFDVYYKVADENQNLADQPWVLVEEENPQPTDDNPSVFREYRYLAGGVTGTLPEFTKFKVKIVMKSYTEALVPSFKDLRIISLSD